MKKVRLCHECNVLRVKKLRLAEEGIYREQRTPQT